MTAALYIAAASSVAMFVLLVLETRAHDRTADQLRDSLRRSAILAQQLDVARANLAAARRAYAQRETR